MRLILARRRATRAESHAPVHAYRVSDDGPAALWRALCGVAIDPRRAEIVPQHTGAPCGKCLALAAVTTDTPPVTQAELEGTSRDVVIGEVAETTADGFSLSWRARMVHRVGTGAARTELDRGTLVLGLCGRLGWGPLWTRPESWPVCGECDKLDAGRTP